jgi:hypothetical protein
MQNYLAGYLKVLPEYQRQQIENILEDNNSLYNADNVSEEQFAELMKQLAINHKPLTISVPQTDKLDDTLYNSFFSSVFMDLNMLFLESQLIESATTNYDRIFEGIISDLNNEISSLRERVDSLRLLNEGEDGLIVEKRSFESITEMEDPNKFSSLFVDRDGSPCTPVAFERVHDQYFCALSKTLKTDVLHNDQGVTTAKIEITDRRGTPIRVNNPDRYKLENAIDGSTDTYWGEVVLVPEPLNISMKKA